MDRNRRRAPARVGVAAPRAAVRALVALAVLAGGCSSEEATGVRDDPPATTSAPPAASAAPVDLESLGIDGSTQDRCDPIGTAACLLPWPNDHFTVADAATTTGRRLALQRASMPANVSGVHVDPADQNRADGWSPGSAPMVQLAGLDVVASGLPGLDDVAASLADDAPAVLLDATTGERHPFWAELDALADPDDVAVLFLRPARNLLDGHRYVVALRGLVDGAGEALEPSPAFAAYRDGQRTTDETFEDRRPAMEGVFEDLARAGVARADLQLAWDFTVASTESTTGPLLSLRDQLLEELGDAPPTFRVETVTESPGDGVRRRVEGTFDVPLFLTDGGAPGGRLVLDDEGRPTRRPGNFAARFRCEIPPAAEAEPLRPVLYGHGLMSDVSEVGSDLATTMSQRHGLVYCATNWYGMTTEDIVNVATVLGDLSTFGSVPDRLQQGIGAFLALGRLLRHPEGFARDAAFRFGDHAAVRTTGELYFDGNSQGAIIGGALTAVSPDLTASVLGEAGMNYSLLLDRSVDFDEYLELVFRPSYPRRIDRILGIASMQLLWDRGETSGFANHLGRERLAGASDAPVLLLGAVGDHQVSEVALRVQARTMGAAARVPLAAAGRTTETDPAWGMEPIAAFPARGSAYLLWDTGSPPSPAANVPPREGRDPHDDTPKLDAAMALKDAFLRPDGGFDDPCPASEPCTASPPG